MALSHSPRSDCERAEHEESDPQQVSAFRSYTAAAAAARQSLTGMYSGSHSGMLRLLISMEIFFR